MKFLEIPKAQSTIALQEEEQMIEVLIVASCVKRFEWSILQEKSYV